MPDDITRYLQDALNDLFVTAPYTVTYTAFQFTLQWVAIALSALYGMYRARSRGMDFFGSMVVAFVACTGGGTLRDLLLGRIPVFWLYTPAYAITIMVVSLLGYVVQRGLIVNRVFGRWLARPVERIVTADTPLLTAIDALALGLWAYLGTSFALQAGINHLVAPILGVMTASFGSVLRDVLFARVPEEFMPGHIYAMAAIVGAIVFSAAMWLGLDEELSSLLCIGTAFGLRVASLRFNLKTA